MTQTPTHPTHPTHPSHPSRPTLASPSSPSSHPSRPTRPPRVDALQYCAWSEEVFRENLRGGLSAVHATVCYHENFRESAANIGEWREMFRAHSDLIFPGRVAGDILRAQESGRLAVFFGAQNPSAMDGDISLVAALRDLGVSFMQLTYNNQSLLGGGCMEARDSGLTRMGREVLAEMNRVGLVADLSHAGARTCMEAIAFSERPVAITHAHSAEWHSSPRGVSLEVLHALAESGGMFGLSLYPHHLRGGSECELESFCEMAARVRDEVGVGHVGIGSDLCRGRPDSAVRWMRDGKWTLKRSDARFPRQPEWFKSGEDFENLHRGLCAAGFSEEECGAVLGGNWAAFLADALEPRA